MNAPLKITPPTQHDLNVAMHASLTRALAEARIENKLGVFSLMAQAAALEADLFLQTQIAALKDVASSVGLDRLVGTVIVDRTIDAAFWGDCS
jgi:hypothetical protein